MNAVMLPVPHGNTYLMPVASIARLFKKHNGKQGVEVKSAPSGLDIAASRTGNKVFLHVANLEYAKSVEASFAVEGSTVTGGRCMEIAPEDLRQAVNQDQPDVFQPRERAIPAGPVLTWRFPAASVTAVELDMS